MAIHFKTTTPRKLLNAYKKAVDDGHVETWSYDADGDFTHCTEQWANQAWLRPKIVPNKELVLHILGPVEQSVSAAVYAIYHGRFIESVLSHCDELFVEGTFSALPEDGDIIS